MNEMKKSLIFTLIIFMKVNTIFTQSVEKDFNTLLTELNQNYSVYMVNKIQTRRFDVLQYHSLLDSLIESSGGKFISEKVGESVKKKKIKLLRFGKGDIKIFMWSQMHGDESTASLALLDLINFFNLNKKFREDIETKISLYIIPMLNPDGAKQYERRNHQEIDINRDALKLQTPEGKILKRIRDEIEPNFAFNLHDQSIYNSVGKTGRPAAIALLAPAFDFERNINEVRYRAIQICVQIKEIIEKFYPGVVARYDDEFEPRAFGDNFQKWGSSTILIESGGYFDDFEKQEIRKMNFLALVGSIYSIAYDLFKENQIDTYFEIPENERRFFDLIVKDVKIKKDSLEYISDIGINHTEKYDSLRGRYQKIYTISDIGDLSTFFGFDTLRAHSLEFEHGKVYEKIIKSYRQLEKLDLKELLSKGYTTIIYQGSYDKIEEGSLIDLMVSSTKTPLREPKRLLGHSANFVLKNENGLVIYAVINGKVINLKSLIGDL